jgi:hypothetical protein
LTKKEAMEQAPTTAPPKVKPGTTEKPGKIDPFKNPKHQQPMSERRIDKFMERGWNF